MLHGPFLTFSIPFTKILVICSTLESYPKSIWGILKTYTVVTLQESISLFTKTVHRQRQHCLIIKRMDSGVKSQLCQYFTQYLWASNTIILNLSFFYYTNINWVLTLCESLCLESIMGNVVRKSIISKHGKKWTIGLLSVFGIYNTIKNLEGIFEDHKKKTQNTTNASFLYFIYILSLSTYHLPILCSHPPKPQRFFIVIYC